MLYLQPPDTLQAGMVTSHREAATVSSIPIRSINASDIERAGMQGVDEVLKGWAGVNLRDYGGLGGLKTVSIRGLGAQHSSICRDGIPITDACNGHIDISRFALDDVEEITLSMGQEDIFTSARTAVCAGNINIKSRTARFEDKPWIVKGRASLASFSAIDLSALFDYKISNRWYSSLYAEGMKSQGDYPFSIDNADSQYISRREGGDIQRFNTRISIGGEIGKAGKLRANASIYSSQRGLPGAVILYAQPPCERLWDRIYNYDISYESELGTRLKVRANASHNRTGNTYLNESALLAKPQRDIYLQTESSVSGTLMYQSLGAWSVSGATDICYNSLDSNTPYSVMPRRLSIYAATNLMYNSRKVKVVATLQECYISESSKDADRALTRNRLSPAISMAWYISNHLTFRAFCRDGYRIPSFNELYYSRVGNIKLESEKALQSGIGLGYSYHKDGLSLGLNTDLYWNEVRDKIVAIPTMWVWRMRNLGRVRMLGAEFGGNLLVRKEAVRWHLALSGALQYALDISDPKAKNYGHQIQYTPRVSGNLATGVEWKGWGADYRMQAVGERFFLSENLDSNRLKPFFDHTLNIYKAFTINKIGMRIDLHCSNLSGVNYEVIHAYPMPGRNYRLSLNIKF